VLGTIWADVVMNASRVDVIAGLKQASPGLTPGFDYGPVQLLPLRWITINRLAKHASPAVVWAAGLDAAKRDAAGAAPVAVPPSKAKATIPVAPAPVAPAPTVAPPVAPVAAPLPTPEPVAVTPDVIAVPPDVIAAGEGQTGEYVCPAELVHPEWDWQPASKVFGVPGLRGKVAVWPRDVAVEGARSVDAIDPHFQWHPDHLQWAVFAAGEESQSGMSAKGIWLFGNRATGKTEFASQFAARTGRPFYKITFELNMEPSTFIGDMGASGGNSEWQDGTMLKALRSPIPAVILLDEITLGQSSHISGPLNEIIHPACRYNVPRTGERIDFNKSHFFIAADNTNGTGDPSQAYVGTNVLNQATLDRFSYFKHFTFLPKDLEIRLMVAKASCSKAIATKVWTILDTLRKKVEADDPITPPSIREALAMCSALRSGLFSDKDAFESAFVGKYPVDVQEDLRVVFTAVFAAKP
jgi:MoxR-like ATPase